MSNGKMLETMKDFTENGKEIPDELFKSLILQDAIDSSDVRQTIAEDVCIVHDKVSLLEERGKANKDEIDRLRGRNNLTDVVTAIGLIIAGWFGLKS